MNRLKHITHNKLQRKNRVRSVVSGTTKRPRLAVHISNRHVTAQVIDDTTGKTLVHASTSGSKSAKGTMTELAAGVGAEIAKKAKAAKIKQVVLDRGSRLYHGRIKALADAARENGLEF